MSRVFHEGLLTSMFVRALSCYLRAAFVKGNPTRVTHVKLEERMVQKVAYLPPIRVSSRNERFISSSPLTLWPLPERSHAMEADRTSRKRRSQNFTSRELNALVDGVVQQKHVLFSKFNDTVTNRQKSSAWKDILSSINAVAEAQRTLADIRMKWAKMLSKTKQKAATRAAAVKRTGGGEPPPELSILEEKVLSCIAQESVEGIPGGFDASQATDPEAESETECLEPQPTTSRNKDQHHGITSRKRVQPVSSPTFEEKILAMKREKLDLERMRLKMDEEKLAVEKRVVELFGEIVQTFRDYVVSQHL